MSDHPSETLRRLFAARGGLLVPGAPNALAARIVADLGFKTVYLTGAGLTNMFLGMPDLGFMDLTQLVQHTLAVRNAVDLPIIVDADTGFGNALNVGHCVRMLERAGANAIQLEDQRLPKRCGHFAGKELVLPSEMANKVKAAVDARRDGVLIVARTDARAGEGFQAAIDRAALYIEAGADVTFVEAPETLDEVRRIPQLLPVPQILNLVIGGKTPIEDARSIADMGYAVALYANAALQGAIQGMQAALGMLHKQGHLTESAGPAASFQERQRLVQKPAFDALERRYATA